MQLIFLQPNPKVPGKVNLQHADCSFNLDIKAKDFSHEITSQRGSSVHITPEYAGFARKENKYQYQVDTLYSQVLLFVSLFPDYYPERLLIRKENRYGADEILAYAAIHPKTRKCLLDVCVAHELVQQCAMYYTNPATFTKIMRQCELNVILDEIAWLQYKHKLDIKSNNDALEAFFNEAVEWLFEVIDGGDLVPSARTVINETTSWYGILGYDSECCKFVTTTSSNFEYISEQLFLEFPSLERTVVMKLKHAKSKEVINPVIVCNDTSHYYTTNSEDGKIVIKRRANLIDVIQLNQLEPHKTGWKVKDIGGKTEGPKVGSLLPMNVLHEHLTM